MAPLAGHVKRLERQFSLSVLALASAPVSERVGRWRTVGRLSVLQGSGGRRGGVGRPLTEPQCR